MKVVYNYMEWTPEPVIEKYRHDKLRVSHMVKGDGVEANEFGRKIVPIGTLVDKDGKVCKITGGAIEGTPFGITANTKDVTDGPEPVAVYRRGHLQGDFLNCGDEGYSEEVGKAIQKALPEIHVYPVPEAAE